jgi:hypothetical protein
LLLFAQKPQLFLDMHIALWCEGSCEQPATRCLPTFGPFGVSASGDNFIGPTTSGGGVSMSAAAGVCRSAYGAVLQRAVGGLVFYLHWRALSFHAPCCAPLLPLFVTTNYISAPCNMRVACARPDACCIAGFSEPVQRLQRAARTKTEQARPPAQND